jgi:4-amino-4-deoxy-L-arabinose transferase-like glycosyltransferase
VVPSAIIDDPRWCRCIAAAAAVFASVVFLSVLPQENRGVENTDYLYYYEPAARAILDNSFFDASRPLSVRDFRYPPLFPVMLAGVFAIARATHLPPWLLFRLFVLFCAAVSAVLVFEIGAWFFSTRGGLFAALAWATYPLWLWSMKQPASETPFVVLMLGSVLFLLELFHGCKSAFVKSAALGLLYGAAMLVRPIAVFLPVFGVIVISASRGYGKTPKRFALAVLMAAVACAVVAPWELWMHERTGGFYPLSQNGPYSMYDGLTFAVNGNDFRQPVAVPGDVRVLMERIDERYAQNPNARCLARALARETVHAPLALCKLAIIKAGRSWYGTNDHRHERGLLIIQLLYLAACCVGMVVLYRKRRETRGVILVVASHVVYFWLFTILFLSTARYMVPVMPLLLVFLPGNLLLLKRNRHVPTNL